MTEASERYYIRPSDSSVDVLARLLAVLEATPKHSHVTKPLSRALVQSAVAEISRLRAENAALLASRASPSSSQP